MIPTKASRRFWTARRKDGEEPAVAVTAADSTVPAQQENSTVANGAELAQLDALNASLIALSAIFPDIQAEVFREMLGTFPEESRLHVVTETLLKHKAKWVRGRWNVPSPTVDAEQNDRTPKANIPTCIKISDGFRSIQYKDSVKTVLYDEFKGLAHSTIRAVLAEHNHSYLDTRTALLRLASKSWRYSFTSLITRRKALDPELCPLVVFRDFGTGPEPTLLPTSCNELNAELENLLIAPLRAKTLVAQLAKDHDLASSLNDELATEANATYDCECCFSSYSFEGVVTCYAGDHFVCSSCVHRTMSEALFGQGWAKSVDTSRLTIRCIAAGSGDECKSFIPRDIVRQALTANASDDKMWGKFEERAARDAVSQSKVATNQCPFCVYAEAADVAIIAAACSRRFLPGKTLSTILLSIIMLILFFIPPFGFLVSGVAVFLMFKRSKGRWASTPNQPETDPNHGKKFICRNPSCQRTSCLRCSGSWIDIHICHQSSRQALRTYLESAVTDSIKRTCPKCNLSFVKSSGCNKLSCVCGYSMCYVCRQDVGKEGYSHFCPHFRANPGDACRECSKCDLYKTEDDEEVIRRAKAKAIVGWKEKMAGKDGVDDLLASLEEDLDGNGVRPRSRGGSSWFAGIRG